MTTEEMIKYNKSVEYRQKVMETLLKSEILPELCKNKPVDEEDIPDLIWKNYLPKLFVDGTITEKDEMQDGKPTGKKVQYTDQIKVMVRGTSDIAAIERCKEKYGLLGRAYYVSKNGKKNPYAFDRADGCPHGKDEEFWGQHELSAEAIEKLMEKLPEKYRDLARQEGGFYNVIEALFTPYGVSSDSEEIPFATSVEEPQSLNRM